MSETVQVALIASIVGPVVLSVILAFFNGRAKREDWRRQDQLEAIKAEREKEVAAQASEAARLLLEAQKASEERLKEVAHLAKISNAKTEGSLKEIHTLVNSDMTAARQSELTQTQALLILMKSNKARDEAAGLKTSTSDQAAIDAQEIRVLELQRILDDRHDAQQRANHDTEKKETAVGKAENEPEEVV